MQSALLVAAVAELGALGHTMKKQMSPLMNNTKWEELRLGMYNLAELSPKWRTKDLATGYTCPWDGEWFYHFRTGGYESTEWVEIQITSPEQEQAVLEVLRQIHVPGEKTAVGFKVFGYDVVGAGVEYL